MRPSALAVLVVAGVLALGCGLGGGAEVEPEDIDFGFAFANPEEYTVSAGDTLYLIAEQFHVEVDDLRGWNGIQGTLIETGQVLFVWPGAEPDPGVAVARGLGGWTLKEIFRAGRPAITRRGPSGPKVAPPVRPPPPKLVIEPEAPVVVARAEPQGTPDAYRQVGGGRIAIQTPNRGSVSGAGVLGALDGLDQGSGSDLAENVAALTASEGGPSRGGLPTGSSLAGGGTAESLDVAEHTPRYVVHRKNHVPNTPVRAPSLQRPPPKKCLAGPSLSAAMGDEDTVSGQGLTTQQIRRSLAGIVRHTARCFPAGTRGDFNVQLEVTVGCDGRVKDTWVADDGGVPRHVTSCIAQTMGYADFAAHALPDGVSFQYPVAYKF